MLSFPTLTEVSSSRSQASATPQIGDHQTQPSSWRNLMRQAHRHEAQGLRKEALLLYQELLAMPSLPTRYKSQLTQKIVALKSQGGFAEQTELLARGLITELTRPGAWLGMAMAPWAKIAGRFGAKQLLLKAPTLWQRTLGRQGIGLLIHGTGFAAELAGFSGVDHGIQHLLAHNNPRGSQALSWSEAAWMMGSMKLMTQGWMGLRQGLHGFTAAGKATRFKNWASISGRIVPELGGISGAWLGYQLASHSSGAGFRPAWEALTQALPLHLQGKLMGAAMSQVPAPWRRLEAQLDAKISSLGESTLLRTQPPHSNPTPALAYYQPPTLADFHAFPPRIQKALYAFSSSRNPDINPSTAYPLLIQMQRYLEARGIQCRSDYHFLGIVIKPAPQTGSASNLRGRAWLNRLASSLAKRGYELRFCLQDLKNHQASIVKDNYVSLPWTDLARKNASIVTLHELRHLHHFATRSPLEVLRIVPATQVPQLKIYGTQSGYSLDEFRAYAFESQVSLQTARRLLRQLETVIASGDTKQIKLRVEQLQTLLRGGQNSILDAQVLARHSASSLERFLPENRTTTLQTSFFQVPGRPLQGRIYFLTPKSNSPRGETPVTLIDYDARPTPKSQEGEPLSQFDREIPRILAEIQKTQQDLAQTQRGLAEVKNNLDQLTNPART